jgi:hypothetical protein
MLDDNTAMLVLMERLGRTVKALEAGVTVAYTRLPAGAKRRAA